MRIQYAEDTAASTTYRIPGKKTSSEGGFGCAPVDRVSSTRCSGGVELQAEGDDLNDVRFLVELAQAGIILMQSYFSR